MGMVQTGTHTRVLEPLWKQEAAHRNTWAMVEIGLHSGSVCTPKKSTQGSTFKKLSQPQGRHLPHLPFKTQHNSGQHLNLCAWPERGKH